ncbi:hypothetical protein [Mycolicibacterium neoaurum]|uniref:Secreted protein n=1 Tax=Mycolicibacterium neoaurum TaxID=1795 RepID=A0AAV2WM83_MYCNE|nr:hypothetical protein [Mycolicibacterium neoaurum]CDQ45300.1 hypothetical protein BN1047_03194 [Mycolicibacterium neoaurum]
MTALRRRIANAALAAALPLTAMTVAFAPPALAEQCSRGQVSYNGNCVDTCNDSQVRNSDTGECQSLISAAVQKARTPAVAKLTPDQLGGVVQLARNVGAIPEINSTIGTSFGIVNTVVGWPAVLAGAAADTAATLAFFGLLPGEITPFGGTLGAVQATGQTFSAVSDVALCIRDMLYLERAGFVTGEILHVDGGQHAGEEQQSRPTTEQRTRRRSACRVCRRLRDCRVRCSVVGRDCCSSPPASDHAAGQGRA